MGGVICEDIHTILKFPGDFMSFQDQIRALADRAPGIIDDILTEEATKNFLIMPFIQALGYSVFDPKEFIPEFDATVGASTKYKLDYAILKEGKPIILIECKSVKDPLKGDDGWRQLFHYFAATEARVAMLTNGIVYRFYADLDESNKMDKKPFLEIDLLNLKDSAVDELKRITKDTFNHDEVVAAATDLKYVGGIVDLLTEQAVDPSEEFTRIFFTKLTPPGKTFTPNAKVQFADYTKRAFKLFIKEQFSKVLEQADFESLPPNSDVTTSSLDSPATTSVDAIVTTEEELQGYYIIKSILAGMIDLNRVAYKDVQSYFGVLLDNKTTKPIVRLYFNNSSAKKLALFDHSDGDKQEEKVAIESLDQIYEYADRIRATVIHYENKKSGGNAPQENVVQELAGVIG
jgi:predicted type IV restriction endonuclease